MQETIDRVEQMSRDVTREWDVQRARAGRMYDEQRSRVDRLIEEQRKELVSALNVLDTQKLRFKSQLLQWQYRFLLESTE